MNRKLKKFKKICKTLTREEFLDILEYYGTARFEKNDEVFIVCCPNDITLPELETIEDDNLSMQDESKCYFANDDNNHCYNCWKQAVKNIKFKGEE